MMQLIQGKTPISTHALTWRATGKAPAMIVFCAFISTHALTWRATSISTSPLTEIGISTHALTWRATYTLIFNDRGVDHFYPRPHMEGDPYCYPGQRRGIISTHALTWRATSKTPKKIGKTIFLPTPSHGGRRMPMDASLILIQFLPTPSHGGRQGRLPWYYPQQNFYPRPHMEGDIR